MALLPRKRWTNPLAWAVWNQRQRNKQRQGGDAPPNLYLNPELSGGSDIVDGVGTPPSDHTISNNSSTISAVIIGENPTYDINASFDAGRLAFRQTRGTSADLIDGHRYRFSAEVWIDGYVDGVSDPQELRGINVNNNASLVINRDNADLSGVNGQWEYVEVIFDIIAPTAVIYLAHGQGVINTSTLRTQTRGLTLTDLGETPPSDGLTFISLEEQATARLFGASSTTFNITAPAETDGVVFVALVQKKNAGAQITVIEVDDGPVVDAGESVSSNPGNQENQLAAFEDKTFGAGAHTVKVTNTDGLEGISLVAVYYKNYTGLTGNFSSAALTGTQAQQVSIGSNSWVVTPGSRGINLIFAGGLTNLVSETPSADYDSGQQEYGTTDVADNRFNGKLKTAVDLSFAGTSSDASWLIDWDGAGVAAEVLQLSGELANS